MAKNGISTLATKEERQLAKLNLAQTKRQLVGTAGYRTNRYYDVHLLPTSYSGNDVVNNSNEGGLLAGRPWKSTPNVELGLWRSTYTGYFDGDWTWFDNHNILDEGAVANFGLDPYTGYTDISIQWIGYFRAPQTANYTFWLYSDDASILWIGDKAITEYADDNWDVYTDAGAGEASSDPIALTAGQYYPIRVQYGNGLGEGYFNFSWENDATFTTTGLTVSLKANSGWDGGLTWINDPELDLAVYNGTTVNYPNLNTANGITSMLFNGITSYWDIANPTSGDFSVGVWFKTSSTVGSGTHFYDNPNLVGSDTSGIANDWGLCMRNGQIGFGGVSGNTAFTTQTFNNGAWHYVVATRVQTTGAMTIFVDGVQLTQITEAPGEVLTDTAKIRVAGDPTNTAFWQGLISEVQFYQLALTPTQITGNFNYGRGTYGV